MAKVKMFSCIRPVRELAAQIAALPYDVYNREEAEAVVRREPLSFLRIDRAETQFSSQVGTYDDCVYKKAHDTLWDMVEKGQYIKDTIPGYYIYELTMDGRTQTGIVACVSIDDYLQNVVKKHENTRAEKEVDRIKHVDACNAQTGPIFLAYKGQKTIADAVNAAKKKAVLYDFVSEDGIRHRVWKMADAKKSRIVKETFDSMDSIYIADGHHRAASAVNVGMIRRKAHPGFDGTEEFNFFLSVLFPDDELSIMDYNRVVKDLNGLSKEAFLQRMEEKYMLECSGITPYKPDAKGEVGMYLDREWYKMTLREKYRSQDPVDGLDVAALQNEILRPVLGIDDPKTDNRIDFVGGIRGLAELEKRVNEDCEVAFAMYPTSISELFAVSDAGLLMPPKSTWFEPKLRSGIFIHEI